MKKYLVIAVAVIAGAAYIIGMRSAQMKCVAAAARAESNEFVNITNIKRNTDEKTFNTAVADIRGILRTKYTIAE